MEAQQFCDFAAFAGGCVRGQDEWPWGQRPAVPHAVTPGSSAESWGHCSRVGFYKIFLIKKTLFRWSLLLSQGCLGDAQWDRDTVNWTWTVRDCGRIFLVFRSCRLGFVLKSIPFRSFWRTSPLGHDSPKLCLFCQLWFLIGLLSFFFFFPRISKFFPTECCLLDPVKHWWNFV